MDFLLNYGVKVYNNLTISLVIVIVLFFYYVSSKIFDKRKYPPSPYFNWPIIGHRLLTKSLSKKLGSLHEALWNLSKKYKTEIFGLTITGNYTVVVFGERLNKKVFFGKEYQARPRNYFNTLRSLGTNKGITMTDGHIWQVQRSFLIKQLGYLGFGGEIMNFLIENELRNLLNDLGDGGNNIDIGEKLNRRSINVLWQLIAGKTLDGDERLPRLVDLMNERSKAFDVSGGYLTHMPWIRFIAPKASGYKLITSINSQLYTIISGTIEEHKRTYDKTVTRDFIDSFLHEMYKIEKDTTFTDDQLLMMCLDLFIAGLQTTKHTLEFFILRMINHPEVQENIQKELDSSIPRDRIPTFQDRINLPYTNAVMTEILRLNHVIPLCGPRRVLWDTELDGYFIPKDTTILMHMNSVTKSEIKWNDPYKFCPERFLNDTNEEDHEFFPFSTGKRRCPGEILARSFIFVFVTGLLHFYKLECVEGQPLPSMDPIPGITNTPKPYAIKLTKRHLNSTS